MSVLSAQTIRALCHPPALVRVEPMLAPFHERTRHEGVTFGLGAASYDVRVAERLVLDPLRHLPSVDEPRRGRFLLASTMERFHMPTDVCATVRDKSTWARRGVAVQNTFIDPGWRGVLTLELSAHGPETVVIPAGAGVCQIVFERLDHPTEQPYEGKYQDQGAGAQGAIMEFVKCPDCVTIISCTSAQRCLKDLL